MNTLISIITTGATIYGIVFVISFIIALFLFYKVYGFISKTWSYLDKPKSDPMNMFGGKKWIY